MKKILLTGVAAACLSFAAVAQQRDSTQTQSNQYQQSDQQQQNRAATDTASTQYRQGDQQQGAQYQQQQSDQNQQQPSNQFNQNADQSRDSLNQNDMERPGNQMQQNREQSQGMQPGVPQNGNMNNQNDNTGRQPGNEQGNATMNQMGSSSQGQANAAPDVEVVKDKEGPDNQVVYQYKGDLYYIDRDKKELVKAKESDLQDAKHDVTVEEGSANVDNDNGSNTNSARTDRR